MDSAQPPSVLSPEVNASSCAGSILPGDCPRMLPELVEMVIDCLHDDKKALAAFSLTTRQWITSSQRHLFRSIRLTLSRQGGEPYPVADFLTFLDDVPHLARFIRKLSMASGVSSSSLELRVDAGSNFIRLLRKMPAIDTLAFENLSLRSLDDHSSWITYLNEVGAPPIRLQCLTLSGVYVARDVLGRLMSLYETCDVAQITQCFVYERDNSDDESALLDIPAETARIEHSQVVRLAFPSLKQLSLQFHRHDLFDKFFLRSSALLRGNGSGLRHLHIDLVRLAWQIEGDIFLRMEDAEIPPLNEVCPSLHTFQVGIPVYFHGLRPAQQQLPLEVILPILSSAPNTLRDLVIEFYIRHSDLDDQEPDTDGQRDDMDVRGNWKTLSNTVAALSHLTSIRVTLSPLIHTKTLPSTGSNSVANSEREDTLPLQGDYRSFFQRVFSDFGGSENRNLCFV